MRRPPPAHELRAPRWGAGRRARGVALLIAVLIAALLAAASTWLAWHQMLAIRRSEDMLVSDRAWAALLGAEAVAAQGLVDSLRGAPSVNLQQAWAKPQQAVLGDGAELIGNVTDLQGRLNLNDLALGAPNQAIMLWRFQRLLTVAGTQPEIAAAVTDWTNPVPVASAAGGAGDDYYLGLSPPYRTAAQPFVSVTSLRLVRGFTQPVYAALLPDVTALPAVTPININTAPPGVFEALGLSAQQAQLVLAQREKTPFASVAQLLESPLLAGLRFDPAGLGVGSQYFQVNLQVRQGRLQTGLSSVIELEGQHARVLLRARNALP